MASGWANDDAVNEQINSTIEDAIARARGEIPRGESLYECEECGAPIPQARREAIPGVRLCIHCQQEKDLQKPAYTGYIHPVQDERDHRGGGGLGVIA